MKKQCGIILGIVLWGSILTGSVQKEEKEGGVSNTLARTDSKTKKQTKKASPSKKDTKRKTNKRKTASSHSKITPYHIAKNISVAINFLIDHKDYMTDVEPLLVKRRNAALDLYRAEGYCILTMAHACFQARKDEDISKLLNWGNIHPLLGKDTYSDGIKKFINLNLAYNNDSYYKASQSEIARDKLREIVHENIFSIIDVINKISKILPGEFYYSGHPYEGISPLNHVALYNVLSYTGSHSSLSPLDVCYHQWQVAYYRNAFLLLKLIAKEVLDSGATDGEIMTDDNKVILQDIATREVGDDAIGLPKKC
jgi:hypothetical protein